MDRSPGVLVVLLPAAEVQMTTAEDQLRDYLYHEGCDARMYDRALFLVFAIAKAHPAVMIAALEHGRHNGV